MGIVLSLSAWNGLRLIEALRFWETLAEYQVRHGPLYLALSGAVWMIAGIILFWGLRGGRTWSRGATFLATIGYTAWVWFDRLVMQADRANWLFALIITILFFVLTVLILLDRDSKSYFTQ